MPHRSPGRGDRPAPGRGRGGRSDREVGEQGSEIRHEGSGGSVSVHIREQGGPEGTDIRPGDLSRRPRAGEIGRSDPLPRVQASLPGRDRKSAVKGKSVSVRVGLGGRRLLKKKTRNTK